MLIDTVLVNTAHARVLPAAGETAVLAHQGGWDEILLVVGPMALIGWLLVVAKRRVDAAAQRATPRDLDER
ncbi:MAG: hypothetical protein AAGG08_18205 [Actinomycetota bacterium]